MGADLIIAVPSHCADSTKNWSRSHQNRESLGGAEQSEQSTREGIPQGESVNLGKASEASNCASSLSEESQ